MVFLYYYSFITLSFQQFIKTTNTGLWFHMSIWFPTLAGCGHTEDYFVNDRSRFKETASNILCHQPHFLSQILTKTSPKQRTEGMEFTLEVQRAWQEDGKAILEERADNKGCIICSATTVDNQGVIAPGICRNCVQYLPQKHLGQGRRMLGYFYRIPSSH